MVSFKSLLAVCSAAMIVMAIPVSQCDEHMTITNTTAGPICDYLYILEMLSNTGAELNVEAGQYNLTWNMDSQFVVGGLGWMPGSSHIINYSGSYNSPGNTSLSIWGMTTNPLVEYFIVESYGSYNPGSGATLLGTVTSDGGTYNIYHAILVNQPSIIGTATYDQLWSVRQSHRTSGSINVANHSNAWRSHGLTLGTHYYQFLVTMGYQNSGSSSFSVSSGGFTNEAGSKRHETLDMVFKNLVG